MELADVTDSKSVGSDTVPVRPRSPAPEKALLRRCFYFFKKVKIMIILIGGATHAGKTCFAQKLLEKYKFPYLSIDHLKMGLIRSGNTDLTPLDDDKLTDYLWPIVREMIKTAIENNQNLIVEGCYIPFDFAKDFDENYLSQIRYHCLVMSENYIRNNFVKIKDYANVIEKRLDDSDLCVEDLIRDNALVLQKCREHNLPHILIDESYNQENFIQ